MINGLESGIAASHGKTIVPGNATAARNEASSHPGSVRTVSTMFSVPTAGVPRLAPPVGLESIRFTVSLFSSSASAAIFTENVLATWPGPKTSVPFVAV
jgi:hypothetical protein